jgi:hypothetical protein
MTIRSLGVLALSALLALSTGCRYDNPHGTQELPPTTRLLSEPSGATVLFQRLNLELETPCELPSGIEEDDPIMVYKDGYRPFTGRVSDLVQQAMETYKVVLQPR